jgi:hypothetical protein
LKSSNQGFVDLHTTVGFFVIGFCFLALSGVIILGAIYCKKIAAKEKLERAKLKAGLESRIPK